MLKGIIYTGLAIVGLGAILAANGPDDTRSAMQKLADGGRYACKEFISRNLHDPQSAQWGEWLEWPAQVDGQEVTVSARMRAANQLGGVVVSRFHCTVRKSGDRWHAVTLTEA